MDLIESLLPAEFIRAFAWTLLHSVWQGGLLALVVVTLMIILRKYRPNIRYAVLYILLMLFPVFFAGTFLMTYNQGKNENYIMNNNALSPQGDYINRAIPVITVNETSQAWYARPVHLFENHAKWLVLLWFTGFFVFLLRFSGSLIYVYRLKTYQVYKIDDWWYSELRNLCDRIGLLRPVRLVESALVRIPMTIGYLKPVILLPLGTLSGVPPQQINAILLHELAHILRKDYLLNIIQSVIELLFFYHPVTWWLSRLIRQEREHICDDLVIGINHDHINYIKALTTMEELNSKSPLLAHAMTGSKKKLLFRVKRLLLPVKLRKGISEGIIAFILLVSLIFTLSLNALSFIPSSFDLTGRESGEPLFNLLPFNPTEPAADVSKAAVYQPVTASPAGSAIPDTIISKSKSGKVIVKVYTDSTDATNEKDVQVFVEKLDRNIGEWNQKRNDYEKEMMIMERNKMGSDNMKRVVLIKSGDSIQIINGDTMYWLANDFDTSIVLDGGYEFYGFDYPEFTRIPEIPDLDHIYLDVDRLKWAEESDRALREYGYELKDLEKDRQNMEREMRLMEREPGEMKVIVSPDAPEMRWHQETPEPPPVRNAEKIIRQELRDDGLTDRGRKYVIELDSKSMFINGEKQPKDVYRKYRKLVESLESLVLEGDEYFKLIF